MLNPAMVKAESFELFSGQKVIQVKLVLVKLHPQARFSELLFERFIPTIC